MKRDGHSVTILHGDVRHDHRQRCGARLRPCIRRPRPREIDDIRARGRRGDRKIDDLAGGRRGRAGAWISCPRVAAGRGGARACLRRSRRPLRGRARERAAGAGGTEAARARGARSSLEDPDTGSDPRTLGVAVRSALETLAAETPVVLAIDDIQWLDPSSASVLTFALRRMGDQPVHVLLARRTDEGAAPSELESAFEPDRVERLPVGPLSLGAVHILLRARLGRTFSRPSLLRVHEASGGNPFYALELARVLGAETDPTQPLLVPETLEGSGPRATRRTSAPTRRRPATRIGARPAHRGAARRCWEPRDTVLEPALDAHVIEEAAGAIRFTHPLLASVLYQSAPAGERRRAHGRLATIASDPLDQARHLALATESPDR